MQKDHRPGLIFKSLEKLHEDFFPVPITPPIENSKLHYWTDITNTNAFSRDDIAKVWEKCHKHLHFGSIKTVLSGRRRKPDWNEIKQFADGIRNLLLHHRIAFHTPGEHILVNVGKIADNVEVVYGRHPAL